MHHHHYHHHQIPHLQQCPLAERASIVWADRAPQLPSSSSCIDKSVGSLVVVSTLSFSILSIQQKAIAPGQFNSTLVANLSLLGRMLDHQFCRRTALLIFEAYPLQLESLVLRA
jgi:hypothetical protein